MTPNFELIAEQMRRVWSSASFEDGNATVPAYMLEQLAITCEVIEGSEAYYNEVEGEEDAK